MLDFLWLWSLFSFPLYLQKQQFFRLSVKTKSKALKACLHGGGGPQIGEVTGDWSPYLTCKRDQIKVRDYMNRLVTRPKRVTSPTWGPPPPCKQALKLFPFVCWNVWQGWALIETFPRFNAMPAKIPQKIIMVSVPRWNLFNIFFLTLQVYFEYWIRHWVNDPPARTWLTIHQNAQVLHKLLCDITVLFV